MATIYALIYIVLHFIPSDASGFTISSEGFPATSVRQVGDGWILSQTGAAKGTTTTKLALTEKGLSFPDSSIKPLDITDLCDWRTTPDWKTAESFELPGCHVTMTRSHTGAKFVFQHPTPLTFTVTYLFPSGK